MKRYFFISLSLFISISSISQISNVTSDVGWAPGSSPFGTGVGVTQYAMPPQANEVVGSRYIGGWVKGKVVYNDHEVNDPNFLFNYDKVGQIILVTKDKVVINELITDNVKSFSLFGADVVVYEHFPNLYATPFLQQLVKDSVSLYKGMTTKYKKADFRTNGIVESGHDYDEYSDKVVYYVQFPDKQLKEVQLRKKSYKEVFKGFPVVTDYLATNSDNTDSEGYLIALIKRINTK